MKEELSPAIGGRRCGRSAQLEEAEAAAKEAGLDVMVVPRDTPPPEMRWGLRR